MSYGYALHALRIDEASGTVILDGDYDLTTDRVNIKISDDDQIFDGDLGADEVGEDANQVGTATDMDGNIIASGQIYDEQFYAISDGATTIWVEVVEIDGQVVGYLVSAPLTPGQPYKIATVEDVDDGTGTTITYDQIYSVPCFGPGTHLMTTEGEVPVEWLASGDRLITRDGGTMPILWVGRFHVTAGQAFADPRLSPLEISADALGPGHPTHPTLLSPQHRVLLSGHEVELNLGTNEALAAVTHLVDADLFTPFTPVRDFYYTHVLLERHEVVLANGLWTETLFLGENMDAALRTQIPRAILERPEVVAGHRQTARLCLKRHETAALLGHHAGTALPDLLRAAG